MKKKIKKINEFLEVPFEIDAETEIKVLSDEEIKNRADETNRKISEVLSKRTRKKRIPTNEEFEVMVNFLLNSPDCGKNDVDELSIKFYGKPYYEK